MFKNGQGNPRWNGGNSEYPNHAEFKRQRAIKLHAVHYKCEQCGAPAKQVHHKDNSKDNHKQQNLEALCLSCHRKTMKKYETKFTKIYGLNAREIAQKLGCSEPTVLNYHRFGTLMGKLLGYFEDAEYF